MRRIILLWALLATLAGCASTPYQPQDDRGYGYAEQALSADSYTVVFIGNSATPLPQTRDFALLHAAQLGASLGFAYLSVQEDKSGMIMLGSGRRSMQPYAQNPNQPPSGRMDGGPNMSYSSSAGGSGGSRAFGGGASGSPAYACALKVRFSATGDGAPGHPAQSIQALLEQLSARYALQLSNPSG